MRLTRPRPDALRNVAAKLPLEALAQRIDWRVAHDVAIVSAALIVGALLWLAVARPLPARLSGPVLPKIEAFAAEVPTSCAPTPPSQ
jgi:hypothetical protein